MQEIKDYISASNKIVLSLMYLNNYPTSKEIKLEDIKDYNPGHLGCSTSINFILANLNHFLNANNLTSKTVVGTGHAGASLITNLWLNGTLEKTNSKYKRNREGLNNLIKDFGVLIRSEINPEYPETIYDGGELGYSLGVSLGYAIDTEEDIIPCIIGDGECETGSLSSSWQVPKILDTKSKVVPIINLNGLKMGSSSILSKLNNEDLIKYFSSLGYNIYIVDAIENDINKSIEEMQKALKEATNTKQPLIIFKSKKGYTLPQVDNLVLEGNTIVHKNPLNNYSKEEKRRIVNELFNSYKVDIFDENGNLKPMFNNFSTSTINNKEKDIKYPEQDITSLDEYIYNLLESNNGIAFSPDEIVSNAFPKTSKKSIEMLNENVLQALYQGYVEAGNTGVYISYEGFLPILSSMITQYYKRLKQKDIHGREKTKPLNYILTSTNFENTYSHQNPDIVNTLLEKNDKYYNIIYPKDKESATLFFKKYFNIKDSINMLIYSKRHNKKYNPSDDDIEVIIDSTNPDLVLCATGDYMLDQIMEVYNDLKDNYNIKVIYVSKPQILSVKSNNSLTEEEYDYYLNNNIPKLYLYSGYSYTLKALLYERKDDIDIYGYNEGVCAFGNSMNNYDCNDLNKYDLINICKEKIDSKKNILERK